MASAVTSVELRSDPPAKLMLKLTKILGEIEAVPKLGTHDQGWKYQRASDIATATRKVCAKHQVIVLFEPDEFSEMREYMSQQNKPRREATVWFTVTFWDGESGESHAMRWKGVAEDGLGSDKLFSKVATSCMKSFLTIQFQIPDDGPDPDRTQSAGEARGGSQARGQQRNQPRRDTGELVEIDPHPPKGTAITLKYADGTLTRFWVRSPGIELQLAGTLTKSVCVEWIEATAPATTATADKPAKAASKFFQVIRIVSVDGQPPVEVGKTDQDTPRGATASRGGARTPPEAANVTKPATSDPRGPQAEVIPPADDVLDTRSTENLDADPVEDDEFERTFPVAPATPLASPPGLFK